MRISDWSSDVCSSDLTKVNRYDDPTVQGNDLPRSPPFPLNTGFVRTPVVGLDISFDIRFTDSYYSDVFKDARANTDPYVLANAQISYRDRMSTRPNCSHKCASRMPSSACKQKQQKYTTKITP